MPIFVSPDKRDTVGVITVDIHKVRQQHKIRQETKIQEANQPKSDHAASELPVARGEGQEL